MRRATSSPTIIGRVPNADRAVFSAHCHNDLGLAVANSLAAIQGGVRQVECSINGIGERAGNASLEELVMALRVRQDRLPYDTGIQSEALFESSQLLSSLTSEPVQANKAIVGRNAFAHEAGIHQDGVLKDARTYEIMRPEDVGQSVSARGSCSGATPGVTPCSRGARRSVSRSPAREIDEVYRAVITLGEHRKAIGDNDLRRIVERVRTPDAASAASNPAHVETVGYGHGVYDRSHRSSASVLVVSHSIVRHQSLVVSPASPQSPADPQARIIAPRRLMSLHAGARIGAYEIVSLLGAGGMGEVYRARDTKLNRDVAIKVLLADVADDPERLARFHREAQTARLAEPSAHRGDLRAGRAGRRTWRSSWSSSTARRWPIASRPGRFRSTKRCRSPGRLPKRSKPRTSKASSIATSSRRTSRYAPTAPSRCSTSGSRKRWIRWPARVRTRRCRRHSRCTRRRPASSSVRRPTWRPSRRADEPVDRRADIWAFGVVVFEMLAGRRAFEGDDISITLAAVLKDDSMERAASGHAAASSARCSDGASRGSTAPSAAHRPGADRNRGRPVGRARHDRRPAARSGIGREAFKLALDTCAAGRRGGGSRRRSERRVVWSFRPTPRLPIVRFHADAAAGVASRTATAGSRHVARRLGDRVRIRRRPLYPHPRRPIRRRSLSAAGARVRHKPYRESGLFARRTLDGIL